MVCGVQRIQGISNSGSAAAPEEEDLFLHARQGETAFSLTFRTSRPWTPLPLSVAALCVPNRPPGQREDAL